MTEGGGKLAALREEHTWDEYDVMELSEATRVHPDGHFSGIFAIVGNKNIDGSEDDWVYKGRVVFGGNNIKDGKGEWAIFEELGSVPTSMSACRVL